MTTSDSVRVILSSRIEAVWTAQAGTAELFREGVQEPDLLQQVEPFALFSVGLSGFKQGDMNGTNPLQRGFGEIHTDLYARNGKGSKPLFDMLDVVRAAFAIQIVGEIRLYGITCRKQEPAVGWQSWFTTVPFQFDSIT